MTVKIIDKISSGQIAFTTADNNPGAVDTVKSGDSLFLRVNGTYWLEYKRGLNLDGTNSIYKYHRNA